MNQHNHDTAKPCADSAPHHPETRPNAARAPLTQDTHIARHQKELNTLAGRFASLISEAEAAKTIGVSPRTLERERFEGKLSCVRIRKRVFYTPEQLDEYIERQYEQHKARRHG